MTERGKKKTESQRRRHCLVIMTRGPQSRQITGSRQTTPLVAVAIGALCCAIFSTASFSSL